MRALSLKTGTAGRKVLDAFAYIGEHHVPRLLVITVGAIGIACGLFFILLPPTAVQHAWSFLWEAGTPDLWGVLFLIAGAALVSAGLVAPIRAGAFCLVEALIFFGLALVSVEGIADNWGTRAICFVSVSLGWLCILGLLASLAPRARKAIA